MERITVIQEDIDNGLPGWGAFCPVALAIKRACPKIKRVSVAWANIRIEGRWITSPPLVREFVKFFDDGRPVEPFEFDLDIPEDLTSIWTSPKT